MSIKVMTLVWDHSQHKGSELLLLLALADFAHDDGGGIFPSVNTMRVKVRMVERSVRYILRKLEESGELVAVGEHPSGTTVYRIDLARLGGAKIAPAKIAPRQDDASRGANGSTPGGQPVAPKPSLNHQQSSEEDDATYIRLEGGGLTAARRAALARDHTRGGALDRDGYRRAAARERRG